MNRNDQLSRRGAIGAIGAIATVAVSGCLGSATSGDQEDPDAGADVEVAETIVDDDALLEVTVDVWREVDELRYVQNEEIGTLEPERDRWAQAFVEISPIGDAGDQDDLDGVGIEDLPAIELETGEEIAPASWPIEGVEFDDVDDDVWQLDYGSLSDGSRMLAPIYDAPATDLAVDVDALLEKEVGKLAGPT